MDILKMLDIGLISHILNELELNDINEGASYGTDQKIKIATTSLIETINPSTGRSIAKVKSADQETYEKIVTASTLAFQSWKQVPAPKRGEIIKAIGEELKTYKDALASLIAIEMGKTKKEAEGEVQEMIDMAYFATGLSRQLYGLTMHSERPHHRLYEHWQPLGVVGIISAFNFPMAVWAWNAFIAAVCGNTCVWKPSSKTPLCALAVQKICERVASEMDCAGVFSLFITEDNTLAERFVSDTRIGLVSFTGSVETGRRVHSLVAKRLGRSLLELGGNNAIIVDETANLELALSAVLFSAIGTAGQRCTSVRRLFLHESIYDTFIARLQKAYSQLSIGDPLHKDTLMGPLIDASAVNAFESALSTIIASGGKILTGGNVLEGPGFFVEPALVAGMKNEHTLVQSETFAPILYVMKYKHFREALEKNNAVPQGLSSALFSQNLIHTEMFLSATGSDCGIANINVGTSGAEIGAAFGGEKESGAGREAGSDAWKNYMRRQTVTINWSDQLPLAQGIDVNFNLN